MIFFELYQLENKFHYRSKFEVYKYYMMAHTIVVVLNWTIKIESNNKLYNRWKEQYLE